MFGLAREQPRGQVPRPKRGQGHIRQSSNFSGQTTPDGLFYSVGLNRTSKGLMEFVGMFQGRRIKMLQPAAARPTQRDGGKITFGSRETSATLFRRAHSSAHIRNEPS